MVTAPIRSLHRWIGAVAAVVLGYVAVTGVALQVEMLVDGGGGSPAGALVGPAPPARGVTAPPPGGPNEAARGRKLHLLLLGLHRGTVIGVPGVILDLAAGLSLVVLSVTGLFVYADLLARRWRMGKRRPFW